MLASGLSGRLVRRRVRLAMAGLGERVRCRVGKLAWRYSG